MNSYDVILTTQALKEAIEQEDEKASTQAMIDLLSGFLINIANISCVLGEIKLNMENRP